MTQTLPDRIAEAVALAEKKRSVKEIAKLCGVSVQTVYDWRKKKTINLKGETLVELAEASGLNARWIINGVGKREGTQSLTQDEQLVLDAFRLFGEEARQSWIDAAHSRLAKEATNSEKAA